VWLTETFGDPCPASPAPCTGILATDAKLNHPTHVAFDSNGNMVLCAWHNSDLFLVNMTTGLMDRICGTGQRPCYNGDEQSAVSACVDLPAAVAFDPQGRLCFTDQANQIIRMIDEFGQIHCIAGTAPIWDPVNLRYNAQFGYAGDEGPATSALLSFERGQIADPSGKICFDPAGNMYIADTKNNCVRRVDAGGTIHLFAGHPPTAGFGGDGGPATDPAALLNGPRDVASDADGNIFSPNTGNNVVRMVATDGTLSTIGCAASGQLSAAAVNAGHRGRRKGRGQCPLHRPVRRRGRLEGTVVDRGHPEQRHPHSVSIA
jgi:DNA-binding beta-propeller fold protein YncE